MTELPRPPERLRRELLVNQFKTALTKLPEFRQAVAEKYSEESDEGIDAKIATFFSENPKKGISTPNYFPGIDFQKDGYEFNVNYSSQARQLTLLKQKKDSFLIINLGVGPGNKDTATYSDDPKSIITDSKKALPKAQDILTSLKPK